MHAVQPIHLERLRQILGRFPERRPLPKVNAWMDYRDEDVWYRIVGQVATVGRARPVELLFQREDLLKALSYRRLCRLKTDEQVQREIWGPLREVACRYVTSDWSRCPKSRALTRNLRVLHAFPGGPRGFVKAIADVPKGPGQAAERIAFVSGRLHYIKNKGARDLLITGFGLLRDNISFDVRVLGALRQIGIEIPVGVPASATAYAAFEMDLVENLCRPMRLHGADLDQLLFLHYNDIKTMRFE